jgi:sugar phosphate isomerase/epimerase
MNIAVSNIAWPIECEAALADAFTEVGVKGVEIAPTKKWPDLSKVSDAQVDAYRRFWNERGISVVAAQALLFGKPELTLFEDADIRRSTLQYLRRVVQICARLGAAVLVFGSPKNRRMGERNRTQIWQEAVDFFGALGECARSESTTIALEANPPEYGADFITRAEEAVRLVKEVGNPGLCLHLDAACMTLVGDDPETTIRSVVPWLVHFHASEQNLAPLGFGSVDHKKFAAELAAVNYRKWVSIEMRQCDPFDIQSVMAAIMWAQANYRIT